MHEKLITYLIEQLILAIHRLESLSTKKFLFKKQVILEDKRVLKIEINNGKTSSPQNGP